MMKKILTVLCCLVILLLFSLYYLFKRNLDLSKFYENRIVALKEHIEESILLNKLNMKFSNELKSIDYKSFNVDEIHNDGIKYLLLVSRAGCFSCIEHQIPIIEDYNHQHVHNIGVVFSNQTIRELQLYKKTRKIESKLFITQYGESLEKAVRHGPLLVEIKEDNSFVRIFRPIPEFPKLTDKYLELE